MKIHDLFDHIYCINLERRPDRWSDCEKEFDKMGIKGVERFVATDGRELPAGELKPGELGINNSVMRIFRDAIEKSYSSIFVLEDDVEFASDTLEMLQAVPSDWEIIHFGSNYRLGKPQPINDKIVIPNKPLGAYAIAFKRRAYEELLERLNYREQVDVTYANNLHHFKSYGFVLPTIWVKPSWSDIAEGFRDHPKLRRPAPPASPRPHGTNNKKPRKR